MGAVLSEGLHRRPSRPKLYSAVLFIHGAIVSQLRDLGNLPGNKDHGDSSDDYIDMSDRTGWTVFNDPVHGHMEFHPLLVAIINTPQFERLRYLKQLGCGYFVYPGAAHNRLEHSMGVCHLAGELVCSLRMRQPDLRITGKDVLCVQVAGLCHDLGHGPLSHAFEGIIRKVRPDRKWTHEQASLNMFDHMLTTEEKVKTAFTKYGLTEEDKTFIKELILGEPPTEGGEGSQKRRRYGPGSRKAFLYEIVANKRNGVDVDKWDYFKRDCHQLGISSNFDHKRLITFARVIDDQICFRNKEVFNLYKMFQTRFALHRSAYQHRVVHAVELMFEEALKAAEEFIRIPGKDGKLCKISECIDDMDAYTNLTDRVFHQILLTPSKDANVQRAKGILRDIQRRNLYRCVGESSPFTTGMTEEAIRKDIFANIPEAEAQRLNLTRDDILVKIVKLDFGKGNKNPVDDVRFFYKDLKDKAVEIKSSDVSILLPHSTFSERLVRVYFRSTEDQDKTKEQRKVLKEAFEMWEQAQKHLEPSTSTATTP